MFHRKLKRHCFDIMDHRFAFVLQTTSFPEPQVKLNLNLGEAKVSLWCGLLSVFRCSSKSPPEPAED